MMKKCLFFLVWMLLVGITSLSCSDKGKILTGIQDGEELKEGAQVPFLLDQNYPNPFNPSTTIGFDIAFEIHVRLKVFADDWQEVQTLINRKLQAGRYVTQFNAVHLPSGEYCHTMEAGGITQIRKMKLVK